jgi:pimeloyl-ACP methyl ester carboxylesterase
MPSRRPALLAVAAFLTGLASLAGPAAAAPNADPSLHTDLGTLCSWNFSCGGTAARLKWSRTGPSCWSNVAAEMPFAVVLRGNGFPHTSYDYLQDHLAQNGIVSAALDVLAEPQAVSDYQDAADEAETFLDSQCFEDEFLDRFSIANPVDFAQTAIVGHSRGGETARYLAANLVSHAEIDVRAVVALAPTRATTKTLYGTQTSAYLLLYGTGDPDVPPQQAFAAHDLTGWQEISTPTSFDLDRGMKLLVNGSHSGFSDPPNAWVAAGQQNATKGYVHAFLRAWLKDDWQFYQGYIRGDEIPASLPEVLSQFSTRVARKVIDSFEDLSVTPSTIGGMVSSYSMNLINALDLTTLTTTPHAGRGLRIRPSADSAYVSWSIPFGQRDFADYLVLSLRIGQIAGNGPVEARIGFRPVGEEDIQWVDLADYGGIPERLDLCVDGDNACDDFETFGTMRTIRIPVDDLGDVDDVETIYLQFQSGAINDQFILDNLEFAETFGLAPLP